LESSANTVTRSVDGHQQSLTARFSLLSEAERQVLMMVLRGSANKTIASSLHISRRTVEDRRARMMEKLQVETLADLVRLAIEAGEHPDH